MSMTRFEDYKNNLTIEQLAELLVTTSYEEDIDYDWNEEPFSWGYETYYYTPDNICYAEFEDAVKHTLFWLTEEIEGR